MRLSSDNDTSQGHKSFHQIDGHFQKFRTLPPNQNNIMYNNIIREELQLLQ